MDFTPSGRPKLGYSYPSDQRRAGPAPLASFEDLPSDEQVSPEGDVGDDNTLQDLSPDPEEFDHILSFDSRDVLTQPSPHKVTIPQRQEHTNGHHGPNHEYENQSTVKTTVNGISGLQSTLPNTIDGLLSPPSSSGQQLSGCWSSSTPTTVTYSQVYVDEETGSGEVTPTGYSSPMVPGNSGAYDRSAARPSGGSVNLMVPSGDESGGEKSPSPDSRRKGSWTDIFFRGRSRSRSKSPIGSECSQKSPGFEQQEVATTNTPPVNGGNSSTGKNKEKKVFFSFLKVGRKNSSSSTNNGSTPQAQQQSTPSSSSSHQSSSSNPSKVAMPSQENDTISSARKQTGTNNDNNNNHSSMNTTLSSTNNKFDSTISSSRPMAFGVDNSNADGNNLHGQLTITPDLNEPCESQQDIIKVIEKAIEQRMSDLSSSIQLDYSLDESKFDEIESQLSSSTLTDNQKESNINTIDSKHRTDNNSVEQVINTHIANSLPKPNLTRKLRTYSETTDDECQSLPRSFKTKEIDSTINRGNETTVVATIEHNSSERGYSSGSDLEESSATLNAEVCGKKAIYLKRQSSETSENDFEAATLLTHDSIDYEDYDGPTEVIITPDTEEKLARETSSRSSARRRLDVNTIPVERPRSTTPINIAPLEAFLSVATPSPDPNVEKIRLSLPEDTFISANYANNCSRIKSPRKSNPAIWLEFCEKGLHSPKNFHRRRRSTYDRDSSPRNSLINNIPGVGSLGINSANPTLDAFTPVNETSSQAVSPLTPITPLDFEDQWTPFGDNFNPYAFIKENLEHTVERYKWSMECDKCDCLIGKLGSFNSNDPSGCNTPAEDQMTPLSPPELGELGSDDQPLMSPISCSCDCHLNMSILSSNNQVNKGQHQQQQDGLFSISSDISSASSRLIQASSASSSKSSSVGEVEDKVSS